MKMFFVVDGGTVLCELEVNKISPAGLVKHCLMKFVNVLGMFGLMKSIHPPLLFLKSNVS